MKIIHLKVIPNARKNAISEEDGKLKVHVMAPAVDGKANKAVLEALAEFYHIKKNAVRLIKGEKSREKVFEINI